MGIATFLPAAGASAAGGGDPMDFIRSIAVDARSIKLAVDLHESQCEGSHLKSGWDRNIDLDGGVVGLPPNLSIKGSAMQRLEHLCSNFEHWLAVNKHVVADTLEILAETEALHNRDK
jgi:hypothetical protein